MSKRQAPQAPGGGEAAKEPSQNASIPTIGRLLDEAEIGNLTDIAALLLARGPEAIAETYLQVTTRFNELAAKPPKEFQGRQVRALAEARSDLVLKLHRLFALLPKLGIDRSDLIEALQKYGVTLSSSSPSPVQEDAAEADRLLHGDPGEESEGPEEGD